MNRLLAFPLLVVREVVHTIRVFADYEQTRQHTLGFVEGVRVGCDHRECPRVAHALAEKGRSK